MSDIPPSTLTAYQGTDYYVSAEPPFVLRIGAASEPLRNLYRQHESNCAAFVTACNPYSQRLDAADNAAHQDRLRNELEQRGLTRGLKFFKGEGRQPNGGWPAEPSFLVLGLDLEEAKALGRKHEQNAVVWCGADAVPQLILLR